MALQQKIQFRKLWNCCWGNEAAVIVFDGGERHAVCKSCASRFMGEVQELDEAGVAEFHEWIAEPRFVGAICLNGQWMEHYVVLNMSDDGEITILWLGDGPSADEAKVTTHMTAWNPRRDKLASTAMLDSLDGGDDGSFASYSEFLEVAQDIASMPTYVNETMKPSKI